MALDTINGIAHAKQVLADAGVKMPFEKGYAEHVLAKQAAEEAKEKEKEGKKVKEEKTAA